MNGARTYFVCWIRNSVKKTDRTIEINVSFLLYCSIASAFRTSNGCGLMHSASWKSTTKIAENHFWVQKVEGKIKLLNPNRNWANDCGKQPTVEMSKGKSSKFIRSFFVGGISSSLELLSTDLNTFPFNFEFITSRNWSKRNKFFPDLTRSRVLAIAQPHYYIVAKYYGGPEQMVSIFVRSVFSFISLGFHARLFPR